ncbi:hypothetical protein LIT35_10965 [Peribacillus asahii]|nr:hypothetical protein [Peribacillus asahii]USK87106.1 hypothetical protein LIT35_10965 [Peribacillus asahii]
MDKKAFLQVAQKRRNSYRTPVREEDTDTNNGIWAGGIAQLNLFIVWHSETQTVDQFFNTPEWKSAFANWCAQVRNAFYIQTEPQFKYRCD